MAKTARKFHFLREIAAGGFGSVYLAKVMHNDGFSRLAAVKLLHQQWSENQEVARRMRDEARLLGWLRHRNIVDVIGLTTIGGRVAVVMEYLEAVDLKAVVQSHVERGQPVPPRGALEAISFVASALDAAYNRPPYQGERPLRVIHRDIKPSNIMLDESGTVKVLDFGVARAEFDQRESHTQEMQFGSIEYMPPERLFMEPDTPASDVYSLGATLFELLALERFGKARSRPERHAAFLEERLQVIRASTPAMASPAGAELIEFLRCLLAHRVDQRPGAAEVVARCRTLSRAFDGDGLTEWAESVIPPLVKAMREAPREPNPLTNAILVEDDVGLGGQEDDVVVDDESSVRGTGVRNPVIPKPKPGETPPARRIEDTPGPTPIAAPVAAAAPAPVAPAAAPAPAAAAAPPAPVASAAPSTAAAPPVTPTPTTAPAAPAAAPQPSPASPTAASPAPPAPAPAAAAPAPSAPADRPPARASRAASLPPPGAPATSRRSASNTMVPDEDDYPLPGPDVGGADLVSAVFLKAQGRAQKQAAAAAAPAPAAASPAAVASPAAPQPAAAPTPPKPAGATMPGFPPVSTRPGSSPAADPSADAPSQTSPALRQEPGPVAPSSSVASAPAAPWSDGFPPELEESPTNVSLAPEGGRELGPDISRTESRAPLPTNPPPASSPRGPAIARPVPGPSPSPAASKAAPLLSPHDVDEEPAPRSRTGWIVGALVVLAFFALTAVAGAYAVYSYINAPIPELATKPPPGEAGDVLAGGPKPADPVTGDVVFISAAPDTAKVTLSCDGKETSGADRVAMTGATADLCVVKVMLKDRTRITTEVRGVEKGNYTCFTNGEKTCTKG